MERRPRDVEAAVLTLGKIALVMRRLAGTSASLPNLNP
jgi:hypothetical protein